MTDTNTALQALVSALLPVSKNESAELSLGIKLAKNSFTLTDLDGVSAHHRLVIEDAARFFLEATHHLPLIDVVRPEILIELGGPTCSTLEVSFEGQDEVSKSTDWEEGLGRAKKLLEKLFARIQAVAENTPTEGPINGYVIVVGEDLNEIRARTPKQAVLLHVARQGPDAGVTDTISTIDDVLMKTSREDWF